MVILLAVFLGLAFLGQIFSVFSAGELRNTIDQNTVPLHDLAKVSPCVAVTGLPSLCLVHGQLHRERLGQVGLGPDAEDAEMLRRPPLRGWLRGVGLGHARRRP